MNKIELNKETIYYLGDAAEPAEARGDQEDFSIGAISCLSCPLYCHPGPGRPSA